MILASLPKSYDVLVTTLEAYTEQELTIEYVTGKLQDGEVREKNLTRWR